MKYFIVTNLVKSYDLTKVYYLDESQREKYGKRPIGSHLATWDSSFSFIVTNPKVEPADYIYFGGKNIVSKKLFNILEKFAKPHIIEFLPIQLSHKNQLLADYGLLNFTDSLDAVDIVNSKILIEDDNFPRLTNLVLDEEKMLGQAVFLLWNVPTALQLIIINETAKNEIIANNIRGIKFVTPNQW